MNQFFKQTLLVVSCFFSFCATAQNLISPITINLPANPPANTAEWAATLPPVMILAQTKMVNGQVNGIVQESRILVTIKSGGSKVCGTYTPQNAPMSNFNSANKNWIGANILTLLGQECILKPGNYELCVQFYALSPAQGGLLGESCKPFTIVDKKDKTVYSPPSNVSPANEKSFTEKELVAPVTFRWTPIIPRPKDPVVYRLRVWQLMQGQSSTQAMKTTTPMVEEEVTNVTQLVKKITFPCGGRPSNCYFVWNVEASKKNAMGEVELLGVSEPASFGINNINKTPTTASCTLVISPGPCLNGNVGACGAVPGGGQATITGGTAPYSTSSVGAGISGNNIRVNATNEIPAGGGVVVVTDAGGCTASAIIPSCPKYDPVQFSLGANHQDASCASINDGSITASFIRIGVGGGPSPIPNPQSYTVSGYPPTVFGPVTKSFGTSVTGLAPGSYVVTGVGSSCWNNPNPISIQTVGVASATCPCTLTVTGNPAPSSTSCGLNFGGGSGYISGGTLPYTSTTLGVSIQGNNIAIAPIPGSFGNVLQTVTIKDNAGCIATGTILVAKKYDGRFFNILNVGINATCINANDGMIQMNYSPSFGTVDPSVPPIPNPQT
jgi:hypothetical protein